MADETVSNGQQPKESLSDYFLRVAREQERRLAEPEHRNRLASYTAWQARQFAQARQIAIDERQRAARERDRLRAEAMAKLEQRMLAAGRVRLFIDPGRPWGEGWLADAQYRVPGLSAKTVPRGLGVGALDFGLDELARARSDGKAPENEAGFVIDLARRVMRREKWRWATERDALDQPHLVVPLDDGGRPLSKPPIRQPRPAARTHLRTAGASARVQAAPSRLQF